LRVIPCDVQSQMRRSNEKKSPLQDDMRCWCNSKLFYETVNSLSHGFLNRLTESAAEHLSAWHHVFEIELVWRGNLIQIEVACTGDTLFREFLGGIPGGVWHKPAGVENIHIGRGSKVLQRFRRDKQRSLGVYRPGRGLHTIRARHAHKGGKTKRGQYHIELSAAKCWLLAPRAPGSSAECQNGTPVRVFLQVLSSGHSDNK
jgi:hypothetical protein